VAAGLGVVPTPTDVLVADTVGDEPIAAVGEVSAADVAASVGASADPALVVASGVSCAVGDTDDTAGAGVAAGVNVVSAANSVGDAAGAWPVAGDAGTNARSA
jgi:hypothetical protein